ncbi:hypothetical protein WME86_24920 [Sorangium sp. So ce1024]
MQYRNHNRHEHTKSKAELQHLLDSDFRGLVVAMINKLKEIRKVSCLRDNVYVFIGKAHHSIAKHLGTNLTAAVRNATIVEFTGTPTARNSQSQGTFKIFNTQDKLGYLRNYSIAESIVDDTTSPSKHVMPPSEIAALVDMLDKECFDLGAAERIEKQNKILDRAVGLRTLLAADDYIESVAKSVTEHFEENALPLHCKAFLVAVSREACAKYKFIGGEAASEPDGHLCTGHAAEVGLVLPEWHRHAGRRPGRPRRMLPGFRHHSRVAAPARTDARRRLKGLLSAHVPSWCEFEERRHFSRSELRRWHPNEN